ncbi:MAG: hypothetical protein L6U16_13860 [Porphyromonadaceae bacterium]|nr:MAG: hypothetical protein L6U16_13860 [Porphyromonadaceae bacterium]
MVDYIYDEVADFSEAARMGCQRRIPGLYRQARQQGARRRKNTSLPMPVCSTMRSTMAWLAW